MDFIGGTMNSVGNMTEFSPFSWDDQLFCCAIVDLLNRLTFLN